jgi:hypothetical protein
MIPRTYNYNILNLTKNLNKVYTIFKIPFKKEEIHYLQL